MTVTILQSAGAERLADARQVFPPWRCKVVIMPRTSACSRVAGALRPGGALAVLDLALQPPQGAGRSAAAFLHTFSLSLFHGEGGQVYRLDELTELL
jgi:hypothetical protein